MRSTGSSGLSDTEQERIDTPHGRVAVRARTGSPTYVLVHGLGGSKVWMDPLFDIAPSGVGLTAVDLLGHGDSERPGCSSWRSQAEAVLTCADRIGQAAWLVLHSMSSAMLPDLVRAKGSVAGVVLIEGDLVAEQAEWSRTLAAMDDQRLRGYFPRFQASAVLVMRSQLAPTTPRESVERFAEAFRKADGFAVRDLSREGIDRLTRGTVVDSLALLGLPVHYIAGRPIPASGTAELARIGASVAHVAGRSHFPMIDAPMATLAEILHPDRAGTIEE